MTLHGPNARDEFRRRIAKNRLLSLIRVLSAQIAAERFEGVFCGECSFAAGAHGLLDVGDVNWRDIADSGQKGRKVFA